MGRKATKVEIQERIETVLRMIIDCKRRSEIIAFSRETWGIGQAMTNKYIERARLILREDYSHERADFIAAKLGVLEKVIQASLETGQNSNAVGAIRLMGDLIGAFPDKK